MFVPQKKRSYVRFFLRSAVLNKRITRSTLTTFIDRNLRYLFPAPAVLFVGALVLFPLTYALYLSFHEWIPSAVSSPDFVGFSNYIHLLKDNRFHASFLKTIYFLSISISFQMVVGIALALMLERDYRGKRVVRTLFLLPMMATPVAISLVWMMMLDPTIGVFNYFLSLIGLPKLAWMAEVELVIPAFALIDSWRWTPFVMLIVASGLSALPHEPFEAARIDGASYLQIIKHITLPLLRPTIMVALTFRIVDGLKVFDIIAATTDGGPANASELLYVYTFHKNFQDFTFGYGSATIIVFALLILGVSLVLSKLRRTEH